MFPAINLRLLWYDDWFAKILAPMKSDPYVGNYPCDPGNYQSDPYVGNYHNDPYVGNYHSDRCVGNYQPLR